MAFILHPRPLSIALGLTLGVCTYKTLQPRNRLLCDSAPAASLSPRDWSASQYSRDAQVPIIKKGGLNPGAVRQISSGSILGVVGGLAVSVFSKPLALLIGLLIVGLQFAESRGIHLIPYNSMQRYVKGMDLRSLFQDNVAFKLAFGSTFALTGFAQL